MGRTSELSKTMNRPVAWIQKKDGEFSNINFLTAYIGLRKFQGYHVNFFEHAEEILETLTKETVVYAGIPVMEKVFKKLNVRPNVDYYPSALADWMDRKIFFAKVSDVYERVENGEKLFVKPSYEDKKTFNGTVMTKFIDLIRMNNLPPDRLVVCSEPIEFVSEYRCFIHRELGVLGCKHYAGDWKKVIDFDLADVCRKAWTDSPIAYSLDLGLTKEGKTLLVECNDALSLGCYGLDPSMFSIMILDRWNEIMKESP